MVDANSGVVQVPEILGADTAQPLVVPDFIIQKNGYIYIYLSNESAQSVFFDNLGITQITGSVLEETHYYPFGLTMRGISTTAPLKLEAKRKFTGQVLDHKEFSDGSGLDWYAFKYRRMDPQIGRFMQIDPLAAKYPYNSTYAYAENRVINGIDLEGLEWILTTDKNDITQIKVNINFNVSSDLNLSKKQIGNIKLAINNQLDKTLRLSSSGSIKGRVTFNGGNENQIGKVIPSLTLYGDASIIGGMTIFENSTVNIYNRKGVMSPIKQIGNDAVHELFHTLRLEHPFEKNQGTDTKLIHLKGNDYKTAESTDPNIFYNIMNYPMININGKKLGNLWKTNAPDYLTNDQLELIKKEIKLQENGAGSIINPDYFNYWQNTPGQNVR